MGIKTARVGSRSTPIHIWSFEKFKNSLNLADKHIYVSDIIHTFYFIYIDSKAYKKHKAQPLSSSENE